MSRLFLLLTAGLATPLAAAGPDHEHHGKAPEGTSETRYCKNVEATTGTRIERVNCWTREQWADQGVDVDKAWAEEGVRIIG
ncbi:MAG: hypothetical protein HKO13_09345 [Sphingomonas sp.]|nr:hypothetical protein [Sphingomonas sp.]